MSERKEMSTETRSLIAAVLCLLVIAGWSLLGILLAVRGFSWEQGGD